MGEIEDQLERLAAHRAAQVPAFEIGTPDELVVRRRATHRAPVVAAIAACLAVALVIGGLLLFSGSDDPSSVQTPVGPPAAAADSGCAGKAYVDEQRGRHGVGVHHRDGCGVCHHHRWQPSIRGDDRS